MKIKNLTYGLMGVAFACASCDINEAPEFTDADAFLAFKSSAVTVGEADGLVELPIVLTSLSGIETSVEIEVVADSSDNAAVEGTDFQVVSKTLTFTKDAQTQNVQVNIIDNAEFTGNKTFTLLMKSSGDVRLGASKKVTVTIKDDEHPLLFILGDYNISADSYYRGHFDWTVNIDADETDLNKVWISNLNPYFASYNYKAPDYNYFYGMVNAEKTQILVPVGQEIGYSEATLVAFSDPEGDGDFYETTGNLVIDIQDGGAKLVLPNAWGIYEDGWWDLYLGGVTMVKQ